MIQGDTRQAAARSRQTIREGQGHPARPRHVAQGRTALIDAGGHRGDRAAELDFGSEIPAGVKARIRAGLRYLRKARGVVAKEGERATAKWALSERR
jgi:hypothetical protein